VTSERRPAMAPTLGSGKICYIIMASEDVEKSAEFYKKVFRWHVRTRGDGSVAFDDGVGEVSGTWVKGLKPYDGSAMIVYIMVDDMEKTLQLIAENGGTVTEGVGAHAPEITAKFRDPSGNVFGVFQERNVASSSKS
jgi:predicted enzyme related to lactoylglutathione lyase